MTVTSTNLILGPASLYYGEVGATEPSNIATAPASGDWTDVGGTLDGVNIAINAEYTEMMVDQIVDRVGSRLTSRAPAVETNLAEGTLTNLAWAMNNSAPVTGSGSTHILELDQTDSGEEPLYKALIIDGRAPGGKRRRIIIRKTLSTENVEFAYKKDEQTVFAATFTGHYVSSSIKPIKIIDQD